MPKTDTPLSARWCLLNAECKHCPIACHIYQCQVCIDYQAGLTRPAYPVPAIRQGFEYGRNLLTNEVVLLHWYQGPYPG